MLYELHTYRCVRGRKADVLARFRDHVLGLLQRHRIHVVGLFDTLVGEIDEFIYITRFDSWEDRATKWQSFEADPEWEHVRELSRTQGATVGSIRTTLLGVPEFSPRP